MQLWVGLGNPGTKYSQNRHNAGFMAVDRLAFDYQFSPWKLRSSGHVADGTIGTAKIMLLKPQSFMNKSGLPVAELARFHKIAPDQITVFHDEIDLDVGRIRVKQGGGHGGHNGLRDIDRHIGADYWRVRIGVGRPLHSEDVHNWVLNDFSSTEKNGWLAKLLDAMSDEAELLAAQDFASYMSRIAYLAPAPQNT